MQDLKNTLTKFIQLYELHVSAQIYLMQCMFERLTYGTIKTRPYVHWIFRQNVPFG